MERPREGEHCALIQRSCLFNMPVSTIERGSQNVIILARCVLGGMKYFSELYWLFDNVEKGLLITRLHVHHLTYRTSLRRKGQPYQHNVDTLFNLISQK